MHKVSNFLKIEKGKSEKFRVVVTSIIPPMDGYGIEKTSLALTFVNIKSDHYTMHDFEFDHTESNPKIEFLFEFLGNIGLKYNSLSELVGLTFDVIFKNVDGSEVYEASEMRLILPPLYILDEKYCHSICDERLGNETFTVKDARLFVLNVCHGFTEDVFCALKITLCINKTDGSAYINYENFSVKENTDEYQDLRNFLTYHSLASNDFKDATGVIYDAKVTYYPEDHIPPIEVSNRRVVIKPRQIIPAKEEDKI